MAYKELNEYPTAILVDELLRRALRNEQERCPYCGAPFNSITKCLHADQHQPSPTLTRLHRVLNGGR